MLRIEFSAGRQFEIRFFAKRQNVVRQFTETLKYYRDLNKISTITRRDIFDTMTVEGISWNGRLEETEFLSRLYDLENMPSTDSRFNNALGDIWQHRINNYDWDDNWIFGDIRFNLMNCDDVLFLEILM